MLLLAPLDPEFLLPPLLPSAGIKVPYDVMNVMKHLAFRRLTELGDQLRKDPGRRLTLEDMTLPLIDPKDPCDRINILLGPMAYNVHIMAYDQEALTDIKARCVRCGGDEMFSSGWDRQIHEEAFGTRGKISNCRLVLDLDKIFMLHSMKRWCKSCNSTQCDSDGEVLMLLPPAISEQLPFSPQYNIRVLETVEKLESREGWSAVDLRDLLEHETETVDGDGESQVFHDEMGDVETTNHRRATHDYLWGDDDDDGDLGGGDGGDRAGDGGDSHQNHLARGTTCILGKILSSVIESMVGMGNNWSQIHDLVSSIYAVKFERAANIYVSKMAMQAVRTDPRSSELYKSTTSRSGNTFAGSGDFDTPENTLRSSVLAYFVPGSSQFYSNRYLAAMGRFSRLTQASMLSATKETLHVALGMDGNYELWKKANPGGKTQVWLCCVDARTKELLASEWVQSEAAEHLVALMNTLPSNYIIESVSLDFVGEGDERNKKVNLIQGAVFARQGTHVPIYEDLFHPIKCLIEHLPHDQKWFPKFVEKVRTCCYFLALLSLIALPSLLPAS
jgi:hypothetical protein